MSETKHSETITENLFRDFYGAKEFIEKSAIPKRWGFVSKKTQNKAGYPDFFKHKKAKGFDFYIVIETKATNHQKACDETKFYMQNNKIDGDIIGIAVSGQTTSKLKVTYYFKNADTPTTITALTPKTLLPMTEIVRMFKKEKFGDSITDSDLHNILTKINKKLHKNNVRDTDRSLFFSGIMIALTDTNFRKTYKDIQSPTKDDLGNKTPKAQSYYLNEAILSSIATQLKNKISNNLSKEIEWKDSFSFIKTMDFNLDEYKDLISLVESEIFVPFKNDEKQDILGKAYKIFLHKSGKIDNKNIILTPDHIKSFMLELARLGTDDVVIDTCTGTGGFLMEAMEIMVGLAQKDTKKIKRIKEKQLIGFEVDRVLFALACSNMFLHGDGKSNLFFRSSLADDNQHLIQLSENQLLKKIKSLKPTKCIINPPYENNNPIKFTKQALEYLEPNGKLIIIMPRTTLKNNIEVVKDILEYAKLDFIIKMPENLFREQGRTVNTAIFGFTKTRHQNNDKTIFYTLKDDGLVSIQHKGRVDRFNRWSSIKNDMLNVILSMPQEYQKRILDDNRNIDLVGFKENDEKAIMLDNIFNFEKGSLQSESNIEGEYVFITAGEEHKTHNTFTHNCEALIYAVSASGSLGRCHYFNGKFVASDLCVILTPKKDVKVEMKFYEKYLNSLREKIVDELADGASKLTIGIEELKKYRIKPVSPERQREIVDEIEKNQQLILKKQREIDALNEAIQGQFHDLI